MKKLTTIATLLLALLPPATACTPRAADADPAREEPGQAQKASAKTKPAKVASIADLCKDPALFADREVTVKGLFQGFQVAECRFPEAASPAGRARGDWLFRTGGDCLYVTGGVPEGIDPIDSGLVGRGLVLTARVSRNEAGKLFLTYVEGHLATE